MSYSKESKETPVGIKSLHLQSQKGKKCYYTLIEYDSSFSPQMDMALDFLETDYPNGLSIKQNLLNISSEFFDAITKKILAVITP